MRSRALRGEFVWRVAPVLTAIGLLATACAPAAAPTPTTAAPAAQPTTPAASSPAPKPATSPAASPAASPSASPSAASSIGAPMQQFAAPSGPVKDTIVVSMGQAPDTLHPAIGSMLARTEVLGAVFTHPIVNDDRGQWVAEGLQSVPTVDNGGAKYVGDGDDRHLEVTFKIRPGVKWQDGRPTTSKDIAFTWKLEMDPKFPATDRGTPEKVAGIDTPDDQTAVVKYMSAKQARDAAQNGFMGLPADEWAQYKDQKEPLVDPFYFSPPFADSPTSTWLPEHLLSSIAPDQQQASDWANKPVGNGPYRIADAVPNQSITLQAVPDYFLGAPPTKQIVFRIITDTNATLAALRAGEIDVATQVQGPDLNNSPDLDKLQGYKPYYIPGTAWEHIDLNLTDPVLKDKNVRKALMFAIDRQQIVDRILFGKTRVATSWIQPGVPAWAYDESCVTPYKYDANQAQQLLTQAGFTKGSDGIFQKDGQPLKLQLSTTDAALRQNVSQVIQAQLKQAGIDLELNFIPGRGLFDRQGPLIQGKYQLGLYTWISAPDPDSSTLYTSRSIPTPQNNFTGQNYPRYSNPQVDQFLLQGAQELSAEKRKPIYCQAVKAWTDDVPVVPLFQRPVVTTARANMGNFKPTPTDTPETWNSWAWFVPAR